MSAGPSGPPPDRPEPSGEPPHGHLSPLSGGVLAAWAVAGLVLGWLLHRVLDGLGRVVPVVTWSQALVLFFVAAVLLGVAHATRRAVRDGHARSEPHRMVNRLVLARACAFVGALVAGGYVGYALSWVGVPAELAGERLVRSLLAGLGGVTMTAAALLLERACRVRGDDEAP